MTVDINSVVGYTLELYSGGGLGGRQQVDERSVILTINGIIIDFGNSTLRDQSGHSISLRPQSFAVLRYLAENANRLVTKDELIQAVWPGIAVTDDSIVQCIHDIRRALLDEDQFVLKTVPKHGYQLALPAKLVFKPNRLFVRAVALTVLLLLLVGAVSVWWLLQYSELEQILCGTDTHHRGTSV